MTSYTRISVRFFTTITVVILIVYININISSLIAQYRLRLCLLETTIIMVGLVAMIGRISTIIINSNNTAICQDNNEDNKRSDHKNQPKGKIMSLQMPKNTLSNYTTSHKNTKPSCHQTSYKHPNPHHYNNHHPKISD